MLGHLGFSYTGLIFLLMLFIPNIIWTRKKPQGYISENENKVLLFLERIGQALTTVCALIFNDFNLHAWSILFSCSAYMAGLYGFWLPQ